MRPLSPTDQQERYFEVLLDAGALTFGQFQTKSGRLSPLFINTGKLCQIRHLTEVADLYACLIATHFPSVEILFGPAYKGIPLAVATAGPLAQKVGREISFAFDRKEIKDHGEGGAVVGAELTGNIVIIEDVLTAGTSVRRSLERLAGYEGRVLGAVFGLDRQERGTGTVSAAEELTQGGLKLAAISDFSSLVERLYNRECRGRVWIDDALKAEIDNYRADFGV